MSRPLTRPLAPSRAAGARVARRGALAAALVAALGGCLDNPGEAPPAGALLTPIATGLSSSSGGAPGFLYVLNSNFDVRYNSGSFQSYDLNVLETAMTDACVTPRAGLTDEECIASATCAPPENCVVVPEELAPVDDAGGDLLVTRVSGLLVGEVLVGSYGSDLVLDDAGQTAYLTIRSNRDVTRVEIDPATGGLSCDESAGSRRCGRSATESDTEAATARDVTYPADPLAIVARPLSSVEAGASGTALFVTHRSGALSYLVDRGAGVTLVDSLAGLGIETVASAYGPDDLVWVTSSLSSNVQRVGLLADASGGTTAEDAFLYDAGAARLSGVGAVDARAVAFDSEGHTLILTRTPGSLVIASGLPDANNELTAIASVDIGAGPARLQLATLAGRELAFVSCYDSRDMYVVDVRARSLTAVIRGMSGPFDFELDPTRNRLYVADFRTSVLRVVDLEPLVTCLSNPGMLGVECAPELIGLVGRPAAAPGAR